MKARVLCGLLILTGLTCVLLVFAGGAWAIVSTKTSVKETEVQARVMSVEEAKGFGLDGASVGFLAGLGASGSMAGGAAGAVIGGLLSSHGCKIPVLVDGKPVVIEAAECDNVTSGQILKVRKKVVTTAYPKKTESETFYELLPTKPAAGRPCNIRPCDPLFYCLT